MGVAARITAEPALTTPCQRRLVEAVDTAKARNQPQERVENMHSPLVNALASALVQAWTTGPITLTPELLPGDAEAAYAAQHLSLALRGQAMLGWKVGAKTADGAIQAAPLPVILSSPARLNVSAGFGRKLGLELEIAFRMRSDLPPRNRPYSAAEVLDNVDGVCASIEWVASRLNAEPAPTALAQLADLQNHGALIAGAWVPYDAALPFAAPQLSWSFDGQDIAPATVVNPAGDPRRLLAWVVNHCNELALTVPAGCLITTGSYTGVYLPDGPGEAVGSITGLPAVRVTIF